MQQKNQVSQKTTDNQFFICLNPQKGLVYLPEKQIDPGAGNNGQVFKGYIGYNTEQKKECCVKKFSFLPNNMNQSDSLKKELFIGRRLDHKNIVKFFDSEIKDNYIYIFMEYCDGGSLKTKMNQIEKKENQYSTKKFSEEYAIKIIQQLIDALVYMKYCNFDGKQGAVHRDIKPDNIVFKDDIPKLIDFGMANFIEISKVTHFIGSPIYMSPQNLKSQEYNLEKNDVWSLGLILYQLVEGNFPFKQQLFKYQDLVVAQEKIQLGLEFHNNVSNKLQNLIVNMLKYEENERYNWDQVMKHEIMAPYFQIHFNEKSIEIDRLLLNYERYLKLQEVCFIQQLDKYILDLTLSKIYHQKKPISQKSEQDQKINQLYIDRFLQKRKFYGFKSENKLKKKLSQKLTKFIEELILDDPDDAQIQTLHSICQIVISLYKNDIKFENQITVHNLLELARF